MEFPGNNWKYDLDSYRRAREAAGVQPVPTMQADSIAPATEADGLVGQLANLQLGRAERRSASGAGAALAPRSAASGLGGSMRLPSSSASSLVGRERHIHSTRHHVPESPPARPEPYASSGVARYSGGYATHTERFDAAPRPKGGFMSGLKKGLKKALGFGGSRKDFSSSTRPPASRPGIDTSARPARAPSGRAHGDAYRMDRAPQSPEHVHARLQGVDHEVDLDPSEFRSRPIPTSPGTRNDCEILWQSVGQGHDEQFDSAPWAGSMGMPTFGNWPALPPSPWESTFSHWDAEEAARMATDVASTSLWGMGTGTSQAGPSSGAPVYQHAGIAPPFGLPPTASAMSGTELGHGIEAMELMHRDLFSSPGIASVDGPRSIWPPVMSTMDVDMDECKVVNMAAGEYDSIGTLGVATCFAMCARGLNDEGQTILGLLHHSGIDTQGGIVAPRLALQRLRSEMHEAGARNVSIEVVGGMSSPDPDYDTLDDEWELLGLRNEFNIRGARLHVNSIEDAREESYVDVLMTAERIYFSRSRLYEVDD